MKTFVAAAVLVAMAAYAPVAAQPANDDFDNATEIPDVTFSDEVDTTEATTEADDPVPDCAGPAGATVWYAFTPSEDMEIGADTFGSNYDTTLSVYTGARGALDEVACNDDAGSFQSFVRFDAIAGETYLFMVGSFGGESGGLLEFSVDVAPPPLEVDLSIDRFGSFLSQTGEAVISGILTCSEPALAFLDANVRQEVGRFILGGFGFTEFECDGETAWSATISPDTGLFRGGSAKANVFAFVEAVETGEFAFDDASASVHLRGGRR